MPANRSVAEVAWERYGLLNAAIVDEVFGESAAWRPVYLGLEADALGRITTCVSGAHTVAPDDVLCEVVAATLSEPGGAEGVFSEHVKQVVAWESNYDASLPPPCIGVLAMLSLVAERMRRSQRFAASNYYGPLMEALRFNDEHRARMGRDFRDETPRLWRALNLWLEETNGFRGLPTAVAFDRRRFIGLPLSQALVRAQDRARLPVLFAQFGLQAGQRVSVQAIGELLAEWLPGSQVTPSLKRLWSKPSNRERISEVVCAELEGWDGAVPAELKPPGHRDDNLFLAAEFSARPREALELFLLARRGPQGDARLSTLAQGSSGAAMNAVSRLGNDMRLQPLPGTSWESLEPGDLISFADLLVANISLESDGGAVSTRRARRLTLLRWYETDHLFIEARRAELLETYVILAVSELAVPVRQLLESSARKGWREVGEETLRGLPPAWTAFQNVQMERVTDVSIEDLVPLQPIARTHLALGGGLPLPGMNVWHGNRLPELRVVVDGQVEVGSVDVRALPTRYLDEGVESEVSIAELDGAGVVTLSEVPELRDGDFRIVVASGSSNRTLATAALRVRTGSWPRRLEDGEDRLIGHRLLDEGALAVYAGQVPLDYKATSVLGAVVQNPPAIETQRPRSRTVPNRPGMLIEDNVQEDAWDLAEAPSAASDAEELPVCFTRAHHVWVLDSRLGNEPVYSICKDCGQERWWDPPRRRRRLKHRALGGTDCTVGHPSRPRHRPLPEIAESRPADMDLVLDALSYAKTGSWRSLRAITAAIDDVPWYAHETARRLEALGHIQVEIDERSAVPVRWRVAPPTLVKPESGPGFLAGSRSARLISAVDEVASRELGGEVRALPQPDGPQVIEVHGLGTDELTLLVDEVNDYRDEELVLSIHPASRISVLLPSLGEIRTSLAELTTNVSRVDRFELETGRWAAADRMDSPGAYRLHSRPRMYAVVPPATALDRRTVVTDVRFAKYLAAADKSFRLMGYEESCSTLLASSGAPLPGLFERAAVLCSGRLPSVERDGTLAYEQVPAQVAESIWQAWRSID